MSFTTVPTFTPSQLVNETDLNTYLRDNPTYLLNRPTAMNKIHKGSNYSFSNTSFAEMDSTLMKISKAMSGTAALVAFEAVASAGTGNTVFLDLLLDGTRIGAGNDGLSIFSVSSTKIRIGFCVLITGLTPGSHTFSPTAKMGAATAVTVYGGDGGAGTDFSPIVSFAEVG